jgi:hypothetical protein
MHTQRSAEIYLHNNCECKSKMEEERLNVNGRKRREPKAKGKIEKNLIEKKEFTDAPARREEIFKNGLRIIRFKMCMDANNVLKP